MREYVGAMRAMFRGEEPPEGEKWPTKFRFMGYDVRPELPIYVAALSPNMLRLAGEIGAGSFAVAGAAPLSPSSRARPGFASR